MPIEAVPVDITPGALYHFCGVQGHEGRWRFPPATYRCVGLFHGYRSGQRMVGYQGMDGDDAGNCYVACLLDWVNQFTRIPSEPVVEKAAGEVDRTNWGKS